MPAAGVQSAAGNDTLLASGARSASSQGASVPRFSAVNWIRAQLNVTALTGTSPVLTVYIEDSIDGTNWNTLATYPDMTATGRQVVNIAQPFTDQIRVRWVISGTTPSATFGVVAYSK